MEELERYCKKLRLGQEILSDYESIEFTDKKDYLTKVLKQSFESLEVRKKNRRIKEAKFDIVKTFENYDIQELELPESITLESLKNVEFIEKSENIIFYGPSGRGKTHLATAIGYEACNLGKSVRFFKVSNLVTELIEVSEAGNLGRYLRNLKKYDLIILDELGYVPLGERGGRTILSGNSRLLRKKEFNNYNKYRVFKMGRNLYGKEDNYSNIG